MRHHTLSTNHYSLTRIDSSKNSVLSIQPRQWLQRHKELTPIGILARISHADHSCTSMLEILGYFVFKLSAVYAFSTPSCPRRITSLDHKVTNDPMKNCSIVVSRGGERRKVVAGPRGVLIIEFNAERPDVGFELDVSVWWCG
jgi:hypothetical protein